MIQRVHRTSHYVSTLYGITFMLSYLWTSVLSLVRPESGRLITKYNDGYVQEERGDPIERGYTAEWYRAVILSRPDQLRLKTKKEDVPESKLVD
jgi:hypothetical protein